MSRNKVKASLMRAFEPIERPQTYKVPPAIARSAARLSARRDVSGEKHFTDSDVAWLFGVSKQMPHYWREAYGISLVAEK